MLLAVDQVAGVECRQFESVTMGDCVGRARFHAVSAENAPVVIDVVDLGVALGAAHAILRGVFGGLDVNAIRRTRGRAQKASHALFQSILVALQHVRAPESGFNPRPAQRPLAVGIVFDSCRLEHLHKGDAHAFGDRSNILQNRHA